MKGHGMSSRAQGRLGRGQFFCDFGLTSFIEGPQSNNLTSKATKQNLRPNNRNNVPSQNVQTRFGYDCWGHRSSKSIRNFYRGCN